MQMKFVMPGLSLALVLAVAPVTLAQQPDNKPPQSAGATTVTMNAKPAIVVYLAATTLSGRLSDNKAGVTVRLEQDTFSPLGDSFAATGPTAMTTNSGRYSLTVKPTGTTLYRVVAQASPSVASAAKLVKVRMRVGLSVSDLTPARGSLVRFSGSVSPNHDGRTVSIQKRSSTGRFATVSRTTLRSGATKSTYSRRVRVSRGGVYRVKILGDGDHASGFSGLRTLNVGG